MNQIKKRFIIKILRDCGPICRDDITEHFGIPRTTSYDILSELRKLGIVSYITPKTGNRGSPTKFWYLKEKERIVSANGVYKPIAHRGHFVDNTNYPWEGGDIQ